jgi:hypothetical protein
MRHPSFIVARFVGRKDKKMKSHPCFDKVERPLPNYVTPDWADTDGNGCLSPDENANYFHGQFNKAAITVIDHYLNCQPFDMEEADRRLDNAFRGFFDKRAAFDEFYCDVYEFCEKSYFFEKKFNGLRQALNNIHEKGGNRLGLNFHTATGVVRDVSPGSPADKAGIRAAGSRILAIDHVPYIMLDRTHENEMWGTCGTSVVVSMEEECRTDIERLIMGTFSLGLFFLFDDPKKCKIVDYTLTRGPFAR